MPRPSCGLQMQRMWANTARRNLPTILCVNPRCPNPQVAMSRRARPRTCWAATWELPMNRTWKLMSQPLPPVCKAEAADMLLLRPYPVPPLTASRMMSLGHVLRASVETARKSYGDFWPEKIAILHFSTVQRSEAWRHYPDAERELRQESYKLMPVANVVNKEMQRTRENKSLVQPEKLQSACQVLLAVQTTYVPTSHPKHPPTMGLFPPLLRR